MIEIRQASEKDAELIQTLAKEVFPETYKDILSAEQSEYMLEWMYSPETIRKQMEENQTFLIASKNEVDCGYAALEKKEEQVFHLQKLYILPSFQGQHLGQMLFTEIVNYIQAIHPLPCVMELNVNRENRAVQFYERMGMKIVREGDFPIGNGYFMNDYIMQLNIG